MRYIQSLLLKSVFVFSLLLTSTGASAQSAEDFMKSGLDKETRGDKQGAIADLTQKAIHYTQQLGCGLLQPRK